jgi:hypothetical protein
MPPSTSSVVLCLALCPSLRPPSPSPSPHHLSSTTLLMCVCSISVQHPSRQCVLGLSRGSIRQLHRHDQQLMHGRVFAWEVRYSQRNHGNVHGRVQRRVHLSVRVLHPHRGSMSRGTVQRGRRVCVPRLSPGSIRGLHWPPVTSLYGTLRQWLLRRLSGLGEPCVFGKVRGRVRVSCGHRQCLWVPLCPWAVQSRWRERVLQLPFRSLWQRVSAGLLSL